MRQEITNLALHGVSRIDRKHYKHPLPENIYDIYVKL